MASISLKQTRHEYERVLTAVFGLLIQCGVRERDVSALAARALKLAITKAMTLGHSGRGELETLGLVLDAWHRDRRYLTSRGKPRAVPLLGRAPSVEALIKSEGPTFDPIELAYRIRSLRLIAPSSGNRYRPSGDAALVSIYGPTISLQYVARCLISLLETVEDNLKGTPTSAPLLERSAEVPDLPSECIESFQKFSRLQGALFTRTVNDWLESRRARGGITNGHAHVRAGVHVHAYVAPATPRVRVSAVTKRSLD
jgi:hypothetical protein